MVHIVEVILIQGLPFKSINPLEFIFV